MVVHMVNVYMRAGPVMVQQTAMMAQMKLTVLLHHVKTKVYGTVVMDNVSLHPMYVMAQVNFVMQAGVLTVPMVQMKV
jgi:hypothetical protein